MNEFLMTTYTIALPVLLGYIVWILKQQKIGRDANSKGTMLLLRAQLKNLHKEYMGKNFLTSLEFREFLEYYEAYHDLGGNGVAEHWKEDIEKLEVKD